MDWSWRAAGVRRLFPAAATDVSDRKSAIKCNDYKLRAQDKILVPEAFWLLFGLNVVMIWDVLKLLFLLSNGAANLDLKSAAGF